MEKEIKKIIIEDLWQEEERKNRWLNSDEFKFNSEKYTFNLNSIDEIKIHKMIYFLYGNFYIEFKKDCIKNPWFKSFKHGPVEYNYYEKKNIQIIWNNGREKKFIIDSLEKISKLSTWRLIELSHLTDPWVKAGSGKFYDDRNNIEIKDIKKYFKKIG